VLEAEDTIASHQTGHNSGVIHSGLYYKPGSSKARLCKAGVDAMYQFCAEESIPHRRTGKLVIATDDAEMARLGTLEERGHANGVQLRRLGREEIAAYEPSAAGLGALLVEDTGVVNYAQVATAIRRRLEKHGGEVRTGHRVFAIVRNQSVLTLRTTGGDVVTSRLVNCAGLQSDRVARLAGATPAVRIVPFRGEYYTLRPERSALVRGLIYPVPDPALPFLGVHFTRGIDDVVEAGPNAVLALKREGYTWSDLSIRDVADFVAFPGFWRMAAAQWRTAASEIRRSLSRARFLQSLRKLIPSLSDADIQPGGSGVRAQAVARDGRLIDDFYLERAPGIVHVLNAPSPAATASLAIGREIAALVLA
jgi:L-2-hydroxyglutarate oxidase